MKNLIYKLMHSEFLLDFARGMNAAHMNQFIL